MPVFSKPSPNEIRRRNSKRCVKGEMVLCFPSTPQKLWMTVALFLGGSSLFGVGLHLSYVNVAPQQARIKARSDFVKDKLRKKYGYDQFPYEKLKSKFN